MFYLGANGPVIERDQEIQKLWECILIRLLKSERLLIYNFIMNQSSPPSNVIKVSNRLLNKQVKKRFGNHITIRINSIHILSKCYLDNGSFVPEINLKFSKQVSLEELNDIDIFLKNQLNTILKITDAGVCINIINLRLLVN